jgi:hypothetical protein
MKRILFILLFASLLISCNQKQNPKTYTKAIFKNKSGIEYLVILPNTYQKGNAGITEVEIETVNKFAIKAFDSIVRDVESEFGGKSKLKFDDYKRQYIPYTNKKNHREIRVNGLMEPIRFDWKNIIYVGGGGGWRYYTGEIDLETGKGTLSFNGAL